MRPILISAGVAAVVGCGAVRPPEPAFEPVAVAPVERVEAASFGPAALPEPTPALLPPPPAPEPPPLLPPPGPPRPRSAALPSGLYNPLPGGTVAGYQADTGLDIMGVRLPVHALAAGTLDYSEAGHTLWTGPSDTPFCVRQELDVPIPWKGRLITHVWYAHLSRLETIQPEGETPRRHVEAGELLGVSGVANHSPHLHLGLLLDGETRQVWGSFLLADEVRKVLGGYRIGARL